jgi:ribose 5-phosphate isomerase RpiB
MIYTARQLQDLHKTNGHVRLPVGARVTPLAHDWLRAKSISVMYGEDPTPEGAGLASSSAKPPALVGGQPRGSASPATPGTILWWCDGPCGQAKAALAAQARESNLQPIPVPPESKYLVGAIKHLAGEMKNDRAAAGILLVQTGAASVVFANRCPSLRAILGTCRDAVQQGVDLVGANVLVIEHPYQTLQQVRNLLSQFLRTRREFSDDVKRQLKELATCG